MNHNQANQTRKPHVHVPVVNTTGGYHFSGGEVWDDIRSTVDCRVCGENLDTPAHQEQPAMISNSIEF